MVLNVIGLNPENGKIFSWHRVNGHGWNSLNDFTKSRCKGLGGHKNKQRIPNGYTERCETPQIDLIVFMEV